MDQYTTPGRGSAWTFSFLISCYQIFAFGKNTQSLRHFCNGLFSGYRLHGCTVFAIVADSKIFIVVRNKHVVPKQRHVERLPSGYSVRESRDDSPGTYWYVVTALEVVRPRNT